MLGGSRRAWRGFAILARSHADVPATETVKASLRRPLMNAVVAQAGTTANVPYCIGTQIARYARLGQLVERAEQPDLDGRWVGNGQRGRHQTDDARYEAGRVQGTVDEAVHIRSPAYSDPLHEAKVASLAHEW
jgi:hypothetical protein